MGPFSMGFAAKGTLRFRGLSSQSGALRAGHPDVSAVDAGVSDEQEEPRQFVRSFAPLKKRLGFWLIVIWLIWLWVSLVCFAWLARFC